MTRTLLALATALLATSTFFAPAAQACISCEYVPEVTRTPVKGQKAVKLEKKRVHIAASKERRAAPTKQRLAKAAPQKFEAKKAEAKKIAVAKAEPIKAETQTESRPISTAALLDAGAAPSETMEETKIVADVGCKKFFPTVGKTMTVPCE